MNTSDYATQREQMEMELARLYSGSTWEKLPDGTVIHTDVCPEEMGMDDRWVAGECLMQMIETSYEMERRDTPINDPNQIDPRNVRREFKEPQIVNLGMRVNRLSRGSRIRHRNREGPQ